MGLVNVATTEFKKNGLQKRQDGRYFSSTYSWALAVQGGQGAPSPASLWVLHHPSGVALALSLWLKMPRCPLPVCRPSPRMGWQCTRLEGSFPSLSDWVTGGRGGGWLLGDSLRVRTDTTRMGTSIWGQITLPMRR